MLWLHELGYSFFGKRSLYDLTLPEIGLLLDGKRTRGIKKQAQQDLQEANADTDTINSFVGWAEDNDLA
jgi:hypothetical protein